MSQVQPPLLPAVRRRRSNRIALALVVVVLGVPLAAFLAWRLNLANDIRALEKKIRDAGEPLTLAELAASRPAVPDEENAAVALLDLWEEEDPAYWKSWRVGEHPITALRSEPISTQLLMRTAQGVVLRPLPWTEEQIIEARKLMARTEDRRRRVFHAVQRRVVEFPVRYADGYEALLPHLSQIRDELLLWRVEAQLAVVDDDVDSALDAVSVMANLSSLLRNEPFLISQLHRANGSGQLLDVVKQLLAQTQPSVGQLAILSEELESLELDEAYHFSLLAERAASLSVFSLRVIDLDSLGAGGGRESARGGLLGGLRIEGFPVGWTGYFALDRHFLLSNYGTAIMTAQNETAEANLAAATLLRAAAHQARTKPYKLISGMMLPGVAKAGDRFAQFEARRRCALAALAVERFRRAHDGKLPAALDALPGYAPEGLWLDPFDNQPLRYRVTPDGYRIYSLGPDQADQQGARQQESDDREAYDVVFAVERPAEPQAE
jgi:hypothetical protein